MVVMDTEIGRIIARLKAKESGRTRFFCFVRNGACPFERTRRPTSSRGSENWTYDASWAHRQHAVSPYKQNQHEGGISSPLIAHWPAGLKAKAEHHASAGTSH